MVVGEYRHGISVMDRNIARVLEAKEKNNPDHEYSFGDLISRCTMQQEYVIPAQANGRGLDTTEEHLDTG